MTGKLSLIMILLLFACGSGFGETFDEMEIGGQGVIEYKVPCSTMSLYDLCYPEIDTSNISKHYGKVKYIVIIAITEETGYTNPLWTGPDGTFFGGTPETFTYYTLKYCRTKEEVLELAKKHKIEKVLEVKIKKVLEVEKEEKYYLKGGE